MAISATQIRSILKALKGQDFGPLYLLLSETHDHEIFRLVKEHKMLLIANDRKELLERYRTCAIRLLDGFELEKELRYLMFISNFLIATAQLNERLLLMLGKFSTLPLNQFLFLMADSIDQRSQDMLAQTYSDLGRLVTDKLSPEMQSSINEIVQNDVRGSLLDVYFAATNAVNSFAMHFPESGNSVVYKEYNEDDIWEILTVVSNINSYNYALDMLSYGEWYLSSVVRNTNNSKTSFHLAIIDELRTKARDMGLKRMNSSRFIKKKNARYIREFLKQLSERVLSDAWEYYEDYYGLFFSNRNAFKSAFRLVELSYEEIDAEDDLLVAMDVIEILSTFTSAFILNVYMIAAQAILSKVKNLEVRAEGFVVPIKRIDAVFNKFLWNNMHLKNKCDIFITGLPIRQHLEIFNSPFIEVRDKIYFFHHIGSNGWTTWVRQHFMKGGKTADLVGKVWEQFISETIREQKWGKVVTGLSLKQNGEILTDVDILFKRDDVLFVAQVKVYYGTGISTFEQWKFRKKIEHGVEQVKKSEEAIRINPKLLLGRFSQVEIDEIKRYRSIVMTNAEIYNGWVCDGITIMSTSSLMQIINGASVKFTDIEGNVLSEKKYSKSDSIEVDEFIDFIDCPLDWRIGTPEFEITAHKEDFEFDVIYFPRLQDKAALI